MERSTKLDLVLLVGKRCLPRKKDNAMVHSRSCRVRTGDWSVLGHSQFSACDWSCTMVDSDLERSRVRSMERWTEFQCCGEHDNLYDKHDDSRAAGQGHFDCSVRYYCNQSAHLFMERGTKLDLVLLMGKRCLPGEKDTAMVHGRSCRVCTGDGSMFGYSHYSAFDGSCTMVDSDLEHYRRRSME